MKYVFSNLPLFLAAAFDSAKALGSIGRAVAVRQSQALTVIVALLLLVTGCKTDEARAKGKEEEKEEAVAFNAKFGLTVPKKTADFIGLQIVEVEERLVPSTNQFSAQVYARRSGLALATASVDKKVLELVRDGTVLRATTSGGEPFKAAVHKVTTLSGSGISELLIEVEDPSNALKIADYLSAGIEDGAKKEVVSIPRNALLKTIEGYFVYTVSGERLIRTPVKIGASNDAFVEITDGLYSGDQVAVQPVMTLWLAELQSLRGGKACADGH